MSRKRFINRDLPDWVFWVITQWEHWTFHVYPEAPWGYTLRRLLQFGYWSYPAPMAGKAGELNHPA